jgi:pimeloyl-ACP methyl ester carboxylesterase
VELRAERILKKAAIVFLVASVLLLATIGIYQYLKVVLGPTFDAEKMPLNYEVLGSGAKQLVLIHGLTGSLNYWKQDIESISNTHTLLLIDLLGFGNSPKPNSNYSLDTQLQAIENVIVKAGFNDRNSLVVGHSMGATIALALLEKHQDWFNGGVFISLPVYRDVQDFNELMSTRSLFDRLTTGKSSPYLCLFHPIFMNRLFKPANLTDQVFDDAKKHTWQSYELSLNEIVLGTDILELARSVNDTKVMFIHGDSDEAASIENARKVANSFSDAVFVTIDAGDHQLFLQQPQLVWNIIRNFQEHNSDGV